MNRNTFLSRVERSENPEPAKIIYLLPALTKPVETKTNSEIPEKSARKLPEFYTDPIFKPRKNEFLS